MTNFFLIVLLLSFVKPSFLTTYSCNSSAPCGCSVLPATLTRIVGGQQAGAQTWGWAVSIRLGNSLCGGSIISSSWVLTAAHCVAGVSASQITVYAGSQYLLTGSQTKSVSTIFPHPNYNSVTYVNDIALLQLSSALNLADPSISVICLPSVSSSILASQEWPSAGTTVVAVGWGRLSDGGSISSTLQQVTMQTVARTDSTCAPLISSWSVQFCASSPCKDTCQGDSGGALMAFTSSNQWVLVGATSSGVGCANPQYAGTYTRIAAFQSWILATTSGQPNNATSSVLTSSTSEINLTATCIAPLHSGSIFFTMLFLLICCYTSL